ncbi:MAG: M48 family metalloprotease [Acidimicrobiia bacterium]
MKNNLKTVALLGGLGGLAVVIGGAIGGGGGATIGFIIGLLMVGFSYWFSAKLALKAAGAQLIEEHQAPQFYGMIRRLAERANLPMPKVAISPSMQPNAFATGRGPRNAVVCATKGLLETMPADELEGVMAHELMHVKNRDILTGSIAAAIATGISYIAQMAMFSAMFGGRDDEDSPNPIAMIAIMILAPLAASLIQMAISRSREYEADADAARLIGSGDPLARALERIEAYASSRPMAINPAQASAWIHNPLAEARSSQRGGPNMAKLFSTHPPTEERIRRLRAM